MARRAPGLIVVLDTSTVVSAALKINSTPEQALIAALASPNDMITSQEIEDEYREVLGRPKFDRFASLHRRQSTLDTILSGARKLIIRDIVQECRDPADDKFLSLAATGSAGVIVSSDDDLRTLNPWRGIPVVSPADFLTLCSLSKP